MEKDSFEYLWGSSPSLWRVLEARIWCWRRRLWWKLLRNTVCKKKDHLRKSVPIAESSARSWACARCQSSLRGPDGKWIANDISGYFKGL